MSYPATVEGIRDRMVSVVEALLPSSDSRVRFRAYRNEGTASFQDWAEANPAAARRRFQIRDTGEGQESDVSDATTELRTVTFAILVAYPKTARDGAGQTEDRDATIDADRLMIQHHIGQHGRENFQPPIADATWISDEYSRIDGTNCVFIEITQVMTFYLDVA